MSEPISTTREPDNLATALTGLIASQPPGSRLHTIGTELQRAHRRNLDRRAAVLKHPDLAKRLVDELGYSKPHQWNGYIPPSTVNWGDSGGMCSAAVIDPYGGLRFVYNQLGRRAMGEQPNNSRQRKVLLEISQEAWDREHQPPADRIRATINPLDHLDNEDVTR